MVELTLSFISELLIQFYFGIGDSIFIFGIGDSVLFAELVIQLYLRNWSFSFIRVIGDVRNLLP